MNKKKFIWLIVALIIIIISFVAVFSLYFEGDDTGEIFDSKNLNVTDVSKTNLTLKCIESGLKGINKKSPYVECGSQINSHKFLGFCDIKGKNIYLNIDSELNKAAYEAMENLNGAVIVYNYKTGQTVCQVSKSEDKNDYTDKSVSCGYTPGSIMKIVTAISAIENIDNIYSEEFYCNGRYDTKDGYVLCNDVHEKLDFQSAFTNSCNSSFAEISVKLGNEKLCKTAEELGFNKSIKAHECVYSQSFFERNIKSDVDLGWAGIGQHTTLVTPINFLSIMGAIANDGIGYAPDAIYSIGYRKATKPRKPDVAVSIDSKIAKRLKDMLRFNVEMKYGDYRFEDMEICGKTGTAQVDGFSSHSWFAGFSQDEQFPYAVVCIAEYGGSGYGAAIDISNKTLQYLHNKNAEVQ